MSFGGGLDLLQSFKRRQHARHGGARAVARRIAAEA
jgi:hypothetical protein